tara:strand:+ start:1343 stop:1759 length:417 start_codon:yes stop_codon:yes gene_type:complete
MKVLKPTTDEQTFYFIPQSYEISEFLTFRDDQTNETVIYTPTMVQENDFIKVTGVFNLVEGHFYDLQIVKDFDVWNTNLDLWQLSPDNWDDGKRSVNFVVDKVFCTDQNIDQTQNQNYSINKGEYQTQNTFDNDYIVL